MDCRITLGKSETFLEMLTLCLKEKKKASMLLDQEGLSRADGLIRSIHADGTPPYLELENGQRIEIGSIAAVNGIFAEPYSEC
jgi:hypothetical protein